MFECIISFDETEGPMKNGRGKILLVGSRVAGSSFVQGLSRLNYECKSSATLGEAMQLLKAEPFEMVLAQVRLEDGSGSTLMGPVVKSGGDLFLHMAVQNGSVWMPAVRNGRDCWGASALKPGDFKRQLASAARSERSRELARQFSASPRCVVPLDVKRSTVAAWPGATKEVPSAQEKTPQGSVVSFRASVNSADAPFRRAPPFAVSDT
jgi:DNA-binding NtrC family response regulator